MEENNAPATNGNESATEQRNFNLSYPRHDTQPARLLAVLLEGQKINPLRAWVNLGIYRLSDTVFQLREMGWPVGTDWLEVSNKFGEGCRVALYSLPKCAIEAAGAKGH